MDGLTGLTGIAGFQVLVDADSQASPEHRLGGLANPRHAITEPHSVPYPWEANSTQAAGQNGPYGPDNQMLGDEGWFFQPSGMEWDDPTFDHTPARRAAPWPKGLLSGPIPGGNPTDVAEQLRQSHEIHGTDVGASRKMQYSDGPLNDQWESYEQTSAGHSDQTTIPRQMMSSGFMWGTRDRVQSMAAQNEHGFDSAHSHRRWATGQIPGNFMWMRPGGRPLIKTMAGPARPAIGQDSPFFGDDLGRAFSIDGALLQNVPSEYVAPPQPTLAPAPSAMDGADAVIEWY